MMFIRENYPCPNCGRLGEVVERGKYILFNCSECGHMEKERKIGKEIVEGLGKFVEDLEKSTEISKKYRCTKVVKTEDGFKRIVKDDRPSE
jgi:uncharacterized Zn finger protein